MRLYYLRCVWTASYEITLQRIEVNGVLGVCDLVGVVVTDDTLVLGEAQLAALICGQSKGGQEARSQSMDWSIVIGNCGRKTTIMLTINISPSFCCTIFNNLLLILPFKSTYVWV